MNDRLEDDLTSIQAQLNHVQNRLTQIACRGRASEGLARELCETLDDIKDRCRRLPGNSDPKPLSTSAPVR